MSGGRGVVSHCCARPPASVALRYVSGRRDRSEPQRPPRRPSLACGLRLLRRRGISASPASAEARRVPRRVSALARWCQWPSGTCTAGTDRACRDDRRFGRRSPAPERPRPLAPLVAFACFELGATVPCHVPGAAGCCRRALGASHAALPAQFACGLPPGAPSGRARAPSPPRVSNSRSLLEMRSGGRCQVPGAAGCCRRALGASHAAPPV